MQAAKAARLRMLWGDKPCDHPELQKEYELSGQTGDFVCSTCGKEFTREEGLEHRRRLADDHA